MQVMEPFFNGKILGWIFLNLFIFLRSYEKVQAKCETHFVVDHINVLHSECVNMVREERKQDLKNIYLLLKSVANCLPFLIEQFLQHVKSQGFNAINNLQGDNVSLFFFSIFEF